MGKVYHFFSASSIKRKRNYNHEFYNAGFEKSQESIVFNLQDYNEVPLKTKADEVVFVPDLSVPDWWLID